MTTRSSATWLPMVVAAPVAAAVFTGSMLMATENNPLTNASAETADATSASAVNIEADVAQAAAGKSLSELRAELRTIKKKVAKAESKAAKNRVVTTYSGGSSSSSSSGGNSGSNSSAAKSQPNPPAADTSTGASGG